MRGHELSKPAWRKRQLLLRADQKGRQIVRYFGAAVQYGEAGSASANRTAYAGSTASSCHEPEAWLCRGLQQLYLR